MNKNNNPKDDKLKPLLPTLRTKKRFVRVIINSDKKFSFKECSEGLNEEILKYMGSIDYGVYGVWILKEKFNEEKQELVFKVSTKGKDKLLATLQLINKINRVAISISIVRVSGTLKGVYKEISSSS